MSMVDAKGYTPRDEPRELHSGSVSWSKLNPHLISFQSIGNDLRPTA